MFDETSWESSATSRDDRLVSHSSQARRSIMEKTPQYCQPVFHHKNATKEKSARADKTVVPYSDISRITGTVAHNHQISYQQSVTNEDKHVLSDSVEVPCCRNTRSTISEVPFRITSGTIHSLPKHYHHLSPQSDSKRVRNVSHVEPCTSINSTITAKPRHCQSAQRQSDTNTRVNSLLPSDDSDFETLGNLF